MKLMCTESKPLSNLHHHPHGEIKSLPIGPVEVSSMWYAPNRLGMNTLCIYLWGEKIRKGGIKLVLITRVMEKPGILSSAAILYHIVEYITPNCQRVVAWSDSGAHFRCNQVLSTMGFNLPEKFGVHTA